jgi:hypothetical protein
MTLASKSVLLLPSGSPCHHVVVFSSSKIKTEHGALISIHPCTALDFVVYNNASCFVLPHVANFTHRRSEAKAHLVFLEEFDNVNYEAPIVAQMNGTIRERCNKREQRNTCTHPIASSGCRSDFQEYGKTTQWKHWKVGKLDLFL